MTARLLLVPALLLGAIGAAIAAQAPSEAEGAPSTRPNIVMVLTDDQTLEEMSALPRTSGLIGSQGVNFERAYASYPLCCPARATLLSGQYMHNHQVRGNNPPFGGWERFMALGTEAKALPVWLQAAGYYTVQVGKYLNGYPNLNPPVPPGWDEWYGKLSEYSPALFGNQVYFNYNLLEQDDNGPPAKVVPYGQDEDDYQTDVLRDKAVGAIHRLGGPGGTQPFFIDLWLSAPHAPYISATRHYGAYGGSPVLHNPALNEKDVRDKPRFIRKLHRLKKRHIRNINQRQRNRWAQLIAVDDAVASIVEALEQEGELDETYIVFTSDNGYMAGEHRIAQGKYLPYEPSSHVPLMIRGPGIAPGSRSPELVSNIDVAPTFAAIAGASPQLTVDGRSLLPFAVNPGAASTRALLLEGDTGANLTGGEAIEAAASSAPRAASASLKRKSGVGNLEQEPGALGRAQISKVIRAPAYRAIRTSRYLYVRYKGRGAELYDMLTDPLQLRSRQIDPRYRFVKAWLQAQLAALESCVGASCSIEIGAEPLPLKAAPKPPRAPKKRVPKL